jgi:hypothetical protein
MGKINLDIKLIKDPKIFKHITEQKKIWIDLFSEVANYITSEKLKKIYAFEKGKKVSQGNQLESCPYQVLDLFRNFDSEKGLNLRILNWWGHGLFIVLFFGIETADLQKVNIKKLLKNKGYLLQNSNDPFDYKNLMIANESHHADGCDVLKQKKHLQLIKKIELELEYQQNLTKIISEIDQIFLTLVRK